MERNINTTRTLHAQLRPSDGPELPGIMNDPIEETDRNVEDHFISESVSLGFDIDALDTEFSHVTAVRLDAHSERFEINFAGKHKNGNPFRHSIIHTGPLKLLHMIQHLVKATEQKHGD